MLRPISPDDLHHLAMLHTQCFTDGVWTEQQIAGSLSQANVYGYVAMQDQKPTGFILCQLAADQAEILTLCVHPDRRRAGIARKLVQQSVTYAHNKGAAELFLEVGADNPDACRFYETFGFKQTGKRRDYYQRHNGRADALLYMLTINPADLHTGV